ncbi:MAG TPA: hypothetical protein PK468_15240, partial [Candidatus Hydrogenedentes bacterium]|nr:hypothetical protein [Candidatus Hydrogenedentota bacterium]
MLCVILDHCGAEKDIADVLKRDLLFDHLLMRMYRDANRIGFALLSKTGCDSIMILKIDGSHCHTSYTRQRIASNSRLASGH